MNFCYHEHKHTSNFAITHFGDPPLSPRLSRERERRRLCRRSDDLDLLLLGDLERLLGDRDLLLAARFAVRGDRDRFLGGLLGERTSFLFLGDLDLLRRDVGCRIGDEESRRLLGCSRCFDFFSGEDDFFFVSTGFPFNCHNERNRIQIN